MTFARTAIIEGDISQAKTTRSLVKSSLLRASLESILIDISAGRADVNSRTDDGQTALMFAAANADAEAVKALLQKGADVDAIENTHGWTALVYAIWSGDRSLVGMLLEDYPNVNVKDIEGRTASDHALLSCDFEIMLLIASRPMRGVSSDQAGS
jgi:ankyrin repeat protein